MLSLEVKTEETEIIMVSPCPETDHALVHGVQGRAAMFIRGLGKYMAMSYRELLTLRYLSQ